MKVIWKEDDIKGGRLIQKIDCGITGRWMMSWRNATNLELERDQKANGRCGLVSMADGMWVDIGNKCEVAAHLNRAGYYLPIELLPEGFKL